MAPWQHEIGLLNEGLLFLLLTLVSPAPGDAASASSLPSSANLTLNFFFVEPLHQFTVQDPQNVFGLVVFLVVSVVGGSLLSSARVAAAEARRREAETQVLLTLSRAMIGQTEPAEALEALCREVVRGVRCAGRERAERAWPAAGACLHRPDARTPDGRPTRRSGRWSNEPRRPGTVMGLGHTGLGTSRRIRIVQPAGSQRVAEMTSGAAFVPLRVGDRTLGVLRLDGPIGETPFRDHPEQLLAAFASEAALGVQRAELAQAAAHADALRAGGRDEDGADDLDLARPEDAARRHQDGRLQPARRQRRLV